MQYSDSVDRSEYAESKAKEARLRIRLLEGHLKVADAALYDHVIWELAMLGLGRDKDGNPIEGMKPRTRVQALRAALSAAVQVLPDPHAHVEVDARTLALNVTVDRDLLARLTGSRESRAQALQALAERAAREDQDDATPPR